MARARTSIPRELIEGRKQIDAWRRRRTTRSMPAPLWSLAARLGARHGVGPTARVLGVRYDTLKVRVAARVGEPAARRATFVQVRPPVGMPACRVEILDGRGGLMRIDLPTETSPALEMLGRLFLEQRA